MTLIDVRTKEEFDMQHADGADNFPLQDMMAGKMPNYSYDAEIQVYCRSGNRSEIAKNLMIQNGFTNVTNAGGINKVL